MSQQQRFFLTVVNVFIFALLTVCGVTWALPLIAKGEWFGVALVALCVSAVWHVVKNH